MIDPPDDGQESDVSVRVAAALARVWPVVWDHFAVSGSESAEARERSLVEAKALLTVFLGVCAEGGFWFADKPPGDHDVPLAAALVALQALGEGCALASEQWPIRGNERPAIALRPSHEDVLRRSGVPDWMDRLGFPLALTTQQEVSADAACAAPQVLSNEDERRIGTSVAGTLKVYRGWLGILDNQELWEPFRQQAAQLRRNQCIFISSLRRYADLLRGYGQDHAPIALMAVMIASLAADSNFLLCCFDPAVVAEGIVPYLPVDLLDELLTGTGVEGWLDAQGISTHEDE
jgi:hypothetical protein